MKVIIYADGGSRGNPGIAGSGTVIYADNGKDILREIPYVVGTSHTNNVAEYRGLLEGLKAAAALGATEVEAYMDSKLVVEQMNGRWKIKHPFMQKLALECRGFIQGLEGFQLTWVPRAQNKVADALSNVDMDACAAGAPEGIVEGYESTPDADSVAGGTGHTPLADAAPAAEPAPAQDPAPAAAPTLFSALDEGEDTPTTTLYLLRHGQTTANAAGHYSGLADVALTEAGQEQARAAAAALRGRGIEAIVASPLQRAQDTAAIVARELGLDVETEEDLRELDFGTWDGMTPQEVAQRDPELHADFLVDTATAAPGGESLQALHRRVRAARRGIEKRHGGKTVLVVCHTYPIKSLLRQALDAGPATFRRIRLETASISHVEFGADGGLVRGINETGHLRVN